MINQLFRTRFESNLTAFIVFLALNALLGFILTVISIEVESSLASSGFFSSVASWLLFFCLAAGGLSLLRYNRERNSRLYAQLPVSPRQVRLAYWCHAGLYLCISSLVLLLVVYYTSVPMLDALLFSLLYFFHAGAWLAAASIVTSNTLRIIPEEVRRRTIVYFLLATLVTFLFLSALGLVVGAYVRVQVDGVENWGLLTLLMAALCAGLVALDIHLFETKDNYLG